MERLVRIEAPSFIAGFLTDGAVVTKAAPIIKYMVGWTEDRARAYIAGRGWTATVMREGEKKLTPEAIGDFNSLRELRAANWAIHSTRYKDRGNGH